MKGILRHALIIIIVFFVSFFAEAMNIGDLFGKDFNSGPCQNKKRDEIPNIEYNEIVKIGDQLASSKFFCRAALYYKNAKNKTYDSDEINSLWIKIIESYFYQYDYENFFNEAFSYFDEQRVPSRLEYVQYLMLKSITELARLDKNMNNPYLQYALGANPEQFNQESPKHLLKYRNFLEKYPNSRYSSDVSSWHSEMKFYFNNDYAKEVRFMVMRREYAPAISRYQFLLSQGPSISNFTLIVYECIQAMNEFARYVPNETMVSNTKLARWLVTTEEKINLSTREMVQKKLLEQSKTLLLNLIEKFPQDTWTIKAQQDFSHLK